MSGQFLKFSSAAFLGVLVVPAEPLVVLSRTQNPAEQQAKAKNTAKNTKVAPQGAGRAPTGSRDPWLWPFAQNSIWNMPIGSNARYVDARIGAARHVGMDFEHLARVPAGSPTRSIYTQYSWTRRCYGSKVPQYGRKSIQIPDGFTVADATSTYTPNASSAFLMPDGRTIVSINPLCRNRVGGPVYGQVAPDTDLFGDGIRGSRGGSGLSTLGGSLRVGDLTGSSPIRHAIKINIWHQLWTYYDRTGSDSTRGYRWPAVRADSNASSSSCRRPRDSRLYPCYGGTNRAVETGSLLALPPSVTSTGLGLRTAPGRKLFFALQNYGAYIVDGTGLDSHRFPVQKEAVDEFRRVHGYSMDQRSGLWKDDVNKMVQALHVVDNNSASAKGGGGAPRQPLAPPFAYGPSQSSAINNNKASDQNPDSGQDNQVRPSQGSGGQARPPKDRGRSTPERSPRSPRRTPVKPNNR